MHSAPVMNGFIVISLDGKDKSHVIYGWYGCDEHQCLFIQFGVLNQIFKCVTSRDSLSVQSRDESDNIYFITAISATMDQAEIYYNEMNINKFDGQENMKDHIPIAIDCF